MFCVSRPCIRRALVQPFYFILIVVLEAGMATPIRGPAVGRDVTISIDGWQHRAGGSLSMSSALCFSNRDACSNSIGIEILAVSYHRHRNRFGAESALQHLYHPQA